MVKYFHNQKVGINFPQNIDNIGLRRLKTMSKLIRQNQYDDPFSFFNKLEEAFATNRNTFYKGGFSPSCDIVEQEDATTLFIDMPGMNPEDVEISTENGTLVVKGERKTENVIGGNYNRSERIFGKFVRTFNVPPSLDVNATEATYEKGVLAIRLPKKEEARPKPVQIKLLGK